MYVKKVDYIVKASNFLVTRKINQKWAVYAETASGDRFELKEFEDRIEAEEFLDEIWGAMMSGSNLIQLETTRSAI